MSNKTVFANVLVLAGAAAVVIGAWWFSPVAGMIILGVFGLFTGIAIERTKVDK